MIFAHRKTFSDRASIANPRQAGAIRATGTRPVLLRKIQLDLIDVAPAPAFARLDRPHDRMLRLLKMLRRMLVQRRIAAPYMPTLQTHPQVNPRAADLQTLLTPVGRRLHTPDLVQMGTLHGSTFLEPRFYPPRMAPYKWAKTK